LLSNLKKDIIMPYWLLLRLLLIVAATAVITASATGIAVPFSVLIITVIPGAIAFIWEIWSFFDNTGQMSEETQLMIQQSHERQETILQARQEAAHNFALTIQEGATQSADARNALVEQQSNASTLLLEATREVGRTATTLSTVITTSRETNEVFSTTIQHHATQIVESVRRIALLSAELEEKQDLIDALRSQMNAIQAESAARAATLQQIIDQLTELASINQSQSQDIITLRAQRDELLTQTKMLTKELEFFINPLVTEQEHRGAAAPALFR
jgi:hypothetical protein